MKISSKFYLALLLLAIIVLAVIGSISYKQVQEFRTSANLVAHTLNVETHINKLFSEYAMLQSRVFQNQIQTDKNPDQTLTVLKKTIKKTKSDLKQLTSDNLEQQKRLDTIAIIENTFYNTLDDFNLQSSTYTLNDSNYKTALTKILSAMEQLEIVKTNMLKAEEDLLIERTAKYEASKYFTPLIILLLGTFALCIILFSVLKINEQRHLTKKSNALVENILKSSTSIVSHFEPIYDDEQNIIDFKFIFTNEKIEDVTGESQKSLTGTLLNYSFPIAKTNGLFDDMKLCIETSKPQSHEAEYEFDGQKVWLINTITKLGDGLTTTANDVTLKKQTEQKLITLNKRLEEQNLQLLDSRAFLNNIFKSISNIVMNLAAVRDTSGKIIDFKILFMSDAISDVTGDIPEEIKNKLASDIFPTMFVNSVFQNLVTCVEQKKQVNYETTYNKNGATLWFQATAIKLNDGVTVTTRDITIEKQKALLQKALNEQLKIQNAILNEAERLAEVGSYSLNIKSLKSQLSDNFYQLLECEPREFEDFFNDYISFIHPDDLVEFQRRTDIAIKEKRVEPYTYRVITKTGKIRYFRTNGHFENRNDKNILVGVVQDITKTIKAEQKLKNKNEELKSSNAELKSFNRVASHDLQEPMRKIQMFISRLSDTELAKLSDNGKTYFQKIDKAANRMQMLVKYLLAYARINKTKKDFVEVNLNETLSQVLEDLEERIKETDIHIAYDDLPTLKAIPFQMEQLFNNLISNAIKYRSKTDKPKIVIDCKKFPKDKIPDVFNRKHKHYYRFSIMDNGIGFDPENAEKIFGLFERLHQKDTYSGTGIGLAICRKIAINHKGYIFAESNEDEGATFYTYLPALK